MKRALHRRIHAAVTYTKTLNKYGVGLGSRQLKVLRIKRKTQFPQIDTDLGENRFLTSEKTEQKPNR